MFYITGSLIKAVFKDDKEDKGITWVMMLVFCWLPILFCIIADIVWLPINILKYLLSGENEKKVETTHRQKNNSKKGTVNKIDVANKPDGKKIKTLEDVDYKESTDRLTQELNIIKKKGYDINETKRLEFGHSPLIIAVIYNDVELIEELIDSGADINFKNNFGDTALITALRCVNNKLEIIQELIAAGADANISNNEGSTALILSVPFEKKEIITGLIRAGANVNAKNHNGDSALISAVTFDRITILKELIKARADINIVDSKGHTALISAAKYGKVKIVQELIKVGADLEIKDNEGNMALKYAIDNGNEIVINALKNNDNKM